MAVLGIWDHDIGNYSGPYSMGSGGPEAVETLRLV